MAILSKGDIITIINENFFEEFDESKSLGDNGLDSLDLAELEVDIEAEFDLHHGEFKLKPDMMLDDVIQIYNKDNYGN